MLQLHGASYHSKTLGLRRLLACGTPSEVKKLMRGAIIEIRMDDPRHAVAVLRNRLPNTTVGLFGDRVHVVCREPERTAPEAEAALSQAGLSVLAIRTIEPSLEDVFISVLAESAT